MSNEVLDIEVIYSTQSIQQHRIQLPTGSRVADALGQPGLLQDFGLHDTPQLQFGIYGKKCTRDQVLQQHDRLEIYRPLVLSPTEARRLRAQTLADK